MVNGKIVMVVMKVTTSLVKLTFERVYPLNFYIGLLFTRVFYIFSVS